MSGSSPTGKGTRPIDVTVAQKIYALLLPIPDPAPAAAITAITDTS